MPAFLKLESVSKSFGPLPALRGVDLEIAAGESAAIVGPSGSGKSTLLNIIGALDRPTSGRVSIEGQDLSGLNDDALADFRNRRLGFIFQAHHLLPQCTALENVLLPTLASPTGPVRAAAPERARRLLTRVGLAARLDHRPGQLSGGERQRVAVVRALINQPALLLADEPTGALDRASAEALAQLLTEINREEKVTLLVVTHAPDLARQMGRVFEMRDGQFV
ncbi:MAG TPA: ABC transporter ATP-binding protein [Verrucomicrobiae bacterium]|jgi:ABC-type lipoprotein export system ATPase subunit|nr:ABC transporter ATP-binding protein [Verrucomicrobiae bacterium]